MLRILMTAATIMAVMSFGGHPAQAYEAPWCAVVNSGWSSVYWDCQYSSFEQCRPHILAGNRGFCNPNPRYHPEQGRYRPRRDRR
jgi:hypothetical protein